MYKTNLLNLVENKLDCKRNIYERKKALRDTQIRSEQRAQVQQVTLKDWNYRTLIMEKLNLEENNLDYKIWSTGERFWKSIFYV